MNGKKSTNNSAADRVVILCKMLWGMSPTKMAKDVGVARSAISNVITGRQQPGRNVLAAIASRPGINAAWLLTGEGEPLSAKSFELPVSHVLLPGAPEAHQHLLTSITKAVCPELHRETRYLYRTASLPQESIAAGDLVLLETNREFWTDKFQLISGRICVFRQLDTGRPLALGRADSPRSRKRSKIRLSLIPGGKSPGSSLSPLELEYGKQMSSIQLDSNESENKLETTHNALEVRIDDIVAVALSLFRETP